MALNMEFRLLSLTMALYLNFCLRVHIGVNSSLTGKISTEKRDQTRMHINSYTANKGYPKNPSLSQHACT